MPDVRPLHATHAPTASIHDMSRLQASSADDELVSTERERRIWPSITAALYIVGRLGLFWAEGLHERDFGLLVGGIYFATIPLYATVTFAAAYFTHRLCRHRVAHVVAAVALAVLAVVVSRHFYG